MRDGEAERRCHGPCRRKRTYRGDPERSAWTAVGRGLDKTRWVLPRRVGGAMPRLAKPQEWLELE